MSDPEKEGKAHQDEPNGHRIPAPGRQPAAWEREPRRLLLELLSPPLSGRDGADIAATRRSNVVQALVHVATDRLPPYPKSKSNDYHGL